MEDGADMLTGRAAKAIRDHWSHGNGTRNPTTFKKQLLEKLNTPPES